MGLRVISFALFFILLVGRLGSGSATAVSAGIDPVPFPVWGDELLVEGAIFQTLGAPAMALDPDGRPHLVYGLNHLFHIWFDGSRWQRETIDRELVWQRESVLAINPSGTIYIADFKINDMYLHILESAGSRQTVRAPFPFLADFSIDLDSNGHPHIVAGPYDYDLDRVFLHSTYGPGGWSVEKIPAELGANALFSFALDSNDRPVIVYEKRGEMAGVWLARQRIGSWQQIRIGNGCVQSGNSLVVDDQDMVHALFSEDCDQTLSYARENDQGWTTMLVTHDGRDPALALDNFGRPNVVSSSRVGQVYAVLNGAFWETSNIDIGQYGAWYNQLILDSAGAAHIASINTNLHYATNSSGQWRVNTPAVQKRFDMVNALALDGGDIMQILYQESLTGDLYWSSGRTGDLKTELLANVPNLEVALGLDTEDRPYVAYIDQTKEVLVFGVRQGDSWHWEKIGPGLQHLSMVIDSHDRPHLALSQRGRTVEYWTREEGEWTGETVSGEIASISNVSLALDSQDRPHIAYAGDDESFLAHRQAANNWIVEPLPLEKVYQLVLGADDQAYFLYSESYWVYDGRFTTRFDSLWFAEPDGEGWSVELLWENPNWNIDADLIVQKNNPVRVALRSTYGEHVYLERGDGGIWSSEEVAWPGSGDISMAIGQDSQPRLLTEDGSSLIFSKREIVWLENHSMLPVLMP